MLLLIGGMEDGFHGNVLNLRVDVGENVSSTVSHIICLKNLVPLTKQLSREKYDLET